MDDGYLLIGSMQWSEKDYPAHAVMPLSYIYVTDATGRDIPYKPVFGGNPEIPQNEEYRSYWAVEILEKSFAAPLKIRMDSVDAQLGIPFVFQFDPGAAPAPGQSWEINQDVQIGDFQVRILKATLTAYPGSSDLIFQYAVQAPPNVVGNIHIAMPISQCMGGGGSEPAEPYETIQVEVQICRADLPPGSLEVQVTGAVLWGQWQISWQP